MTAVLLGLAAALCFGGVFTSLRWAYGRTGVGSTQAAVISVATAAVLVTVAAATTGNLRDLSAADLAPYALAGLFAPGLSHLAMYRSIERFGGTRTAVILGFVPVLSALGAWALLGEPPGALVVVGAVAVVAASLVIIDRGARQVASTGPWAAVVAAVCFAGRDVTIRSGRGEVPALAASATALVVAAAFLLIFNLVTARASLVAAVRRHAAPLTLPGLASAFGYTLLVAAFGSGAVAVVATMIATQTVWAVVLARLLLDRGEWSRRIVLGSLLAAAGGIVVALSR